MWPFKKKEKPTPFDEYAETLDPTPCGDNKTHYYWTKVEGIRCPLCAKQAETRKLYAAEERLATLIAQKVAKAIEEIRKDQGYGDDDPAKIDWRKPLLTKVEVL